MATNQVYDRGEKLSLVVASGVASGDPVEVGHLTGVALNDRGADTATKASVKFVGVFDLSVKGIDDNGNRAIALGEPIYYVDGDTPKLSAKSTGRLFGYALEAVSSGATTTIQVLLAQAPKGVLKRTHIAGGAAGNHTVTGIAVGDEIAWIDHISTAAAVATIADLTSEFTISAADTINNTGGTDTSSDQLGVYYWDRT